MMQIYEDNLSEFAHAHGMHRVICYITDNNEAILHCLNCGESTVVADHVYTVAEEEQLKVTVSEVAVKFDARIEWMEVRQPRILKANIHRFLATHSGHRVEFCKTPGRCTMRMRCAKCDVSIIIATNVVLEREEAIVYKVIESVLTSRSRRSRARIQHPVCSA